MRGCIDAEHTDASPLVSAEIWKASVGSIYAKSGCSHGDASQKIPSNIRHDTGQIGEGLFYFKEIGTVSALLKGAVTMRYLPPGL